jgi:hypothetical protein
VLFIPEYYSVSLSRLKNNIYKTYENFWAKYFGNLKNGQKKCPKMKIRKYFAQKDMVCDHN